MPGTELDWRLIPAGAIGRGSRGWHNGGMPDSAATAASYAYDLHAVHAFASRRAGGEVHPLLRAAALETLPVLLAVADFDAAPIDSLALVESLYADDAVRCPGWVRAFVSAAPHLLGLRDSEPGRLVERVRGAIERTMPDAPAALYTLDAKARKKLEAWVETWHAGLAWAEKRYWQPTVERRAREFARIWASACGEPLPHESSIKRPSTAQGVVDDLESPRPTRRRVRRVSREPARGASLVQRAEAPDGDRVRAAQAARELFSTRDLGIIEARAENAPEEPHWRVAAAVAEMLEGLAERSIESFTVSDGLREVARRGVVSLLTVGYFLEARPIDIERAMIICERWLAIRSRGMLRWQYALVWLIGQHAVEIDGLLANGQLVEVDALLRDLTSGMREEMPHVFTLNEPHLGKIAARLTLGPGSRAALSPHGFARRWCDAYGAAFPLYPSSQRPARAARRLVHEARRSSTRTR